MAGRDERRLGLKSFIHKTKEKTGKNGNADFHKIFLFMSFFVPFELMLSVFACNIIYPFGDQTFLTSDLQMQYMPFFYEFVRKVKAGEGLFYSWNIGMGTNFLALYGNYLASPLHWLAFLIPEEWLVEFVSYLVVIKVGLAGLCAFLFLAHRTQGEGVNSDFSALLFSVFYAMSGYVAAYNFNIMWLDGIILAPLIVMGLERMLREGKKALYVVSLAICILSNFYISILICFFLILYFVLLFFTEVRNIHAVFRFIYSSLLAGGIAAALLLPEIMAMWGSNDSVEGFPRTLVFYFSFLDLICRHGIFARVAETYEKWPGLYCGVAVFLMIPLYTVNRSIPLKKRIGMLLLSAFFLVSFSTNWLDYVWHGMNFPNAFPARQSFLYILIILCMCHDCLVHVNGLSRRAVIGAFLFAGLLVGVGAIGYKTSLHSMDWLYTLLVVAVYAIFLFLYMSIKNLKIRDWLAVLCCIVAFGECVINMYATSIKTMDREAYFIHWDDFKALYNENQPEGDFQRFENLQRTIKNDSALWGYPSASIFSSVNNPSVSEFYGNMGMRYKRVYYESVGATPLSAALLNIGYVYSNYATMEDVFYDQIDQLNGIRLLKARYQLPFGYVAPWGYDLSMDGETNAIEQQNKLIEQLDIVSPLFQEERTVIQENQISFTASENAIYYALLQDTEARDVKVQYADGGEKLHELLRYNNTFLLGEINAGNVTTLTDEKKVAKQAQFIRIYRLDETVLEQAINSLGKTSLKHVKVNNTKVTGNVEMISAGRLITTVPYEKGWTIRVNGEKHEPQTFGGAFIALDLEPGEYEIEMNYVPAGRNLGILITIISIMAFALTEIVFLKKRTQKINNQPNILNNSQ